ncbi:hypothetical protein POM88_036867 [Heracleum sosnowskyi]|uniref:Ubiquitin-like protease family profile domain-containing protein n=1 Tax=Heracleum sosnowskyi TaxID=360622 RepID=A0AAD8HP32_9APIA|nr:hypothetical protein POM88_036867 [Heracleum sosnowskyi]
MDRNWVNADRLSKEYKNGVRDFCEHVAKHVKDTRFILCPCQKCLNIVEVDGIAKLEEHLRCDGIDKTYTCWTYHGENKGEYSSSNMKSKYQSEDIMDTYVFGHTEGSNSSNKNDVPNVFNEELRDHPDMHEKLKDDAALPLWPGCTKFSKLSVVLTLYNLKVGHQVSDVFFTEMLIAVSELLPDGNVLPRRTSRPEGCIAERYLIEEAIEFWSEFIPNVDAIGLPSDRHSGRIDGEGVTRGQQVEVDRAQWYQAHLCVLHNTVDVVPYVDLHKQTISAENPRKGPSWIELEHNRTFIDWFKDYITNELIQNNESISDRVKWLSRGPDSFVYSYKCYLINGYTFYSREHDATSTMQNSGVSITATALHQSSITDKDPVLADTSYFGRIANIWELDYVGFRVPVFDCDWVNNVGGVHVEDSGFIQVDLSKVGYKDDSFIMATQAQQVFYVTDPVDKKWSIVVLSNKLNNTYQVGDGVDEEIDNIDDPFVRVNIPTNMDEEGDYELSYSRNDHDEGEYVNPEFINVHGHERSKPNTKRKRKRKSNKCMNMTSGSCGTSGTDGSKDVNVTEERCARRGIVNMLKVKKARNKGIVQTVNWNQLGQPIGKESVTLVHFVGSYARRNVPIICDDWRKKEWQNVKQNLWDEVKETFNGVGDEHRKKIIHRAGNLHRGFHTRLRSMARDSTGNYSAKPPPYVCALFFRRTSLESVCGTVNERRVCENPTVSQLDAWEYARRDADGKINDPVTLQILQDVVAISENLPEHELTNIGTDDLLARALPLEYPGRVRGLGWGVTKTSLQTTSTASEISKLKNDVSYLINEIKELKRKGCKPEAQSRDSSHMDNFDMDNEVSGQHDDDDDLILGEDLPQGKNPCYLYLDPGRRYVGRGMLHNDPNDRILHGIPLEEGYVRVQFEVAEKSECKTQLPRPCYDANLVGEAPGYFLAWPATLVSMKLETPPRTGNKEKLKHAMGQNKIEDKENKKLADKEKAKTSHDGVLEFVRLAIMFDRVTNIQVDMGPYWNANPWIEHINKENVLEVVDAQWLSASSLAFYIRYLCEVFLSKNPDMAAKFSFVSPHIVSHLVDNSNSSLAKCLLNYVGKDHLLFVPYNVGNHWILVAINTATESIYFMDPAPVTNTKHYDDVKALVEAAMRMFGSHSGKKYTSTMFNSFRWTKVQCPKQNLGDGIYCGYFVGSFIEDLLCAGLTKINANFTYTPRLKSYPLNKMVRFQKNWGGYLYNRYLKGKLLMK